MNSQPLSGLHGTASAMNVLGRPVTNAVRQRVSNAMVVLPAEKDVSASCTTTTSENCVNRPIPNARLVICVPTAGDRPRSDRDDQIDAAEIRRKGLDEVPGRAAPDVAADMTVQRTPLRPCRRLRRSRRRASREWLRPSRFR